MRCSHAPGSYTRLLEGREIEKKKKKRKPLSRNSKQCPRMRTARPRGANNQQTLSGFVCSTSCSPPVWATHYTGFSRRPPNPEVANAQLRAWAIPGRALEGCVGQVLISSTFERIVLKLPLRSSAPPEAYTEASSPTIRHEFSAVPYHHHHHHVYATSGQGPISYFCK